MQGTLFTITGFDDTAKTLTLNTTVGLVVGDFITVKIIFAPPLDDIQITAITGNTITINTTATIGPTWAYVIIEDGGLQYPIHAEGSNTLATAAYSHVEGYLSLASGLASHAEGDDTSSIGQGSHSEGGEAQAIGDYSHAEGQNTWTGDRTTPNPSASAHAHAEGFSTTASGNASHAEGFQTLAQGGNSHAEGSGNNARGVSSHAEGLSTNSNGTASHSEGTGTIANADLSHAEGQNTQAAGVASHSEGFTTRANANYSHAEGNTTTAGGVGSHAEGNNTSAGGANSHAEGGFTTANAASSHVEGDGSIADGRGAHAEGGGTRAVGHYSHAEGSDTWTGDRTSPDPIASSYSHAEGNATTASGISSHAEGYTTVASGRYSHAEGFETQASGYAAHSEGDSTNASGGRSHAEGAGTTASNYYSHAEGTSTTASGLGAHAEGAVTTASGQNSHAEGQNTIASGYTSHAEGADCSAAGFSSHAEGQMNLARSDVSHAEGCSTLAMTGTLYTILARDDTAKTLTLNTVVGLAVGDLVTAKVNGFSAVDDIPITNISGNTITLNTTQYISEYWVYVIKLDPAPLQPVHAEGYNTIASGAYAHAEGLGTVASYPGSHVMGRFGTAEEAYSWFIGNGLYASAPALGAKWLNSNGNMYVDGSFIPGGADYAEMFETLEGITIEPGYFVTLNGKKVRKANSSDNFILGITSSNPSLVGNGGELRWKGKFLTDEWGRNQKHEVTIPAVSDEEGKIIVPERTEVQPILNPEYDPNREYVPRRLRPEWVAVGLVGQILVRDDGSCKVDGYCLPNENGIATRADKGYRVLERTGSNQILVLFR